MSSYRDVKKEVRMRGRGGGCVWGGTRGGIRQGGGVRTAVCGT